MVTTKKTVGSTKRKTASPPMQKSAAGATLERPTEENVTPASPVTLVSAAKAAEWEDEDLCTVIRRNWGDVQKCPPLKEDYMDRITFTGGVARNVPYRLVRQWVKYGVIAKEHVFANNAQEKDFIKATGRDPMQPLNLATAVSRMKPEQIAAILGDEAALQLARDVQKLISSRKGEY